MYLPENAFERRKSQDWARISAVNLTGPILITQLCLPYLKKCPSGGRIINTCSVGGHAGLSNNTLYTMTKVRILIPYRAS
jgi:NAD(P)-dependent dehydrogenase (short-subunit alcohol dehydrogenase family)